MNFLSFPNWMRPAPDSVVADRIRAGKSPYFDAINLMWSFWLLVTPLLSREGYTWHWLLLTLISYPLFLWLFAMSLLAPRRQAFWYPLGMALMSLLLLSQYPSGISYFVYACVMLRRCDDRDPAAQMMVVTILRYMGRLAALNAAFIATAWWIGYPWQLLVYVPVTAFVIGIIVNVEQIAQRKEAALRLSQEEVRRIAATAERERIGRDLHDLLGHTLSLITLKLELSRKLIDRDVVACRRELTEAESVARKALAEVRCAVTGIRATDLAAELAAARLMLETSHVHLEYGELPSDLPPEVEAGLALVLREAATNIARHAGASCARIAVERRNRMLMVSVDDNGCGGIDGDGNGLSGMRERIRDLGGHLTVESPRGEGTRLRAEVPLPASTALALATADKDAPAARLPGTLGSPAA